MCMSCRRAGRPCRLPQAHLFEIRLDRNPTLAFARLSPFLSPFFSPPSDFFGVISISCPICVVISLLHLVSRFHSCEHIPFTCENFRPCRALAAATDSVRLFFFSTDLLGVQSRLQYFSPRLPPTLALFVFVVCCCIVMLNKVTQDRKWDSLATVPDFGCWVNMRENVAEVKRRRSSTEGAAPRFTIYRLTLMALVQ